MLLNNYTKQSPIIGVAGLGGGINSYIFLSSGGDYVISRSLRFNSADTPKLTRTPSSASNRKTWTLSFWIKRTTTGSREQIISAAGSKNTYVEFQSDKLMIEDYNPGVNFRLWTTRVFRDPSAWYHIVIAMDTTQGTSSNRLKLYVNGVQETVFDTATYPSQNYDTSFNNTGEHKIGQFPGNANNPLNAYLADYHLVDGQALAPTDFGEFDTSGVWQPKKFGGSHGTNGFHLDFKDNITTQALGYDAAVTAPTLNPKGGMDVVTYTGNGASTPGGSGSTQTITSLNFQPDFVWIKSRSTNGHNHNLVDVVRGAPNLLLSDSTNAEITNSTDGFTGFTSNGFTLGDNGEGTQSLEINKNGDTYVAWCWKAGGAASSNSNGTITSSVSANVAYGFSVVSWTGAGSGNSSIGHGLSTAPSWIILKNRSATSNWSVYHSSVGNTKRLLLNSTAAEAAGSTFWNNTSPTSSVFTVGGDLNDSSTKIAYVWSEIAGFSKFGSYSGGTNPKTITTGFKPKFLIFKRTDSANHWILIDSTRGGTQKLAADLSVAENDNATIGDASQNIVEFLADGFKLTTTNAATNVSGGTYIYAAYADRPGNNWTPNNLVANDEAAPSKTLTRVRFKTDWNWMYVSQIKINGSALTTGTLDNSGSVWTDPDKWKNGSTGSGNETYSQSARGDWFDVTLASSIASFSSLEIFVYLDSSSGSTTNIFEVELFYSDGTSFTKAYAANGNAPNGNFNQRSLQNFANLGLSPSTIDSLIDSPSQSVADETDTGLGSQITGNYATLNSLDSNIGSNLTNGNLDAAGSSNWSAGHARGTFALTSGKWYWEVTKTGGSTTAQIGFCNKAFSLTTSYGSLPADSWTFNFANGTEILRPSGGGGSYFSGGAMADGDVAGIALDMNAGTAIFYKNGTAGASISLSSTKTGSTNNITELFPLVGVYNANVSFNGGQRAFTHAAPSGYKSLNTSNLPTPTIADGSKYFDTKLYAGNGGTQSITMDNSALSPNFVWIKCRNDAFEHQLFDSVRGALKSLRSDNTSAEATVANSLTSFDSNGFSLGASQPVNNTKNYAAWAWDAGDSNTTIAAGSLNSSLYNTSSTWSNNWTASGNGFGSYPPSYGFDANFDNNINNNAGGQYVTWNTTSYTLSGLLEINCYSSSGVYDVYVNGTKASDTPSSRGWINCGSFADINEIQFGGTSHNSATGLGSAGILIYEIKVAGKTLVDSGVSITTPSLASTVRANPSAGFSIVSYAGNSVNNSTISHGLNGSVPELIITKNLSAAYNWIVYSAELAATKVLALDEAQGAFTPSGGYYGTVGSSTYQLVQGSSNLTNVNNNGNNYVAYCFAPVAGYSAMGSFLGNGSADGPFVFTGFRPAFILVKNSSVVDNWEIYDSTRSIVNPTDHALRPDTSGVEFSHISNNRSFDILSNGFKIRGTNAGINGNGNTLVYYAVAEHPFQSSRAR